MTHKMWGAGLEISVYWR